MNTAVGEDMRDVAVKLNKIYHDSPESYYYIKGFIHCLAQKKQARPEQARKPPEEC